jgi:hypothetical protein
MLFSVGETLSVKKNSSLLTIKFFIDPLNSFYWVPIKKKWYKCNWIEKE